MSAKKKDLLSSAMKRTSEWISSQEVSSDVTVHVGEASFSLHKESQFCSPTSNNSNSEVVSKQPVVDWWAEDLTVLRIDSFQRVLIEMMARGFKQYGLGPVLMLYAQKSLRGLSMYL
ncbi:hypothetical protein Bca52824_055850 [Brassica carinata]|uniref:NPH3 domain-containing protein n=1 Tax=Brassica carinata TaxID=52824 RepID=A0A8X7RA69_BRACI|nr:hypothetical protein Bca52824_055850 [Brassica carinata]